tara:strand:+ start:4960 stop:5835 length:876 start_codon:yes stop_codon:yes gene_type:complete
MKKEFTNNRRNKKMKQETMKITEGAFNKIMAYTQGVCTYHKQSIECYGLLTAPQAADGTAVHDVVLAHNQVVSTASGRLGPLDGVYTADEAVNKGQKILGCWQSHGNGGVFHSGTDDNNLNNLKEDWALNSRVRYSREANNLLVVKRDGSIKVAENGRTYDLEFRSPFTIQQETDSESHDFKLDLFGDRVTIYSGNSILTLSADKPDLKMAISETPAIDRALKETGVAYSLVVNTAGEAYVKASKVDWCKVCDHTGSEERELGLEKIVVENDVTFDDKEIMEEIALKVKKK